MKKVLIFSLTYFPHPNGGAEPAIKEITNRLNQDFEFHMITLRYNSEFPKYEKYENIHIHRIGFTKHGATLEDAKQFPLFLNKYFYLFLSPIKATQLHFKNNFQIIWAMMAHTSGVPSAIFKTFFPKVKYVLTLQEGDPIEHIEKIAHYGGPISWFLFKQGFTKADIIQSISYYLSDWANRLAPNVPKVLIKNGANPNDLKEKFTQDEVEEMKIKLGKKMGDIFLVNTSRVVHQKGIDTTIEALKFLPDNIKFLVVGDGDKIEEYKKLSENLGVSDRVIFTGRVDRNVVTLYRKASDIFVAASRTEGLGNAFVSALASRLPLITTGVGGIADYAKDGVTAWIVPAENPEKIAEKVLEIINNPEKVKLISENARKMVEEEYDWDKIAVKMKEEVFN
jgi:glycosyltransferase involved in cell wall biosynthesis